MSGERRDDGLSRVVATLPVVAVDEAHAARVQAHCRRPSRAIGVRVDTVRVSGTVRVSRPVRMR